MNNTTNSLTIWLNLKEEHLYQVDKNKTQVIKYLINDSTLDLTLSYYDKDGILKTETLCGYLEKSFYGSIEIEFTQFKETENIHLNIKNKVKL